jgi:hypothetical protein
LRSQPFLESAQMQNTGFSKHGRYRDEQASAHFLSLISGLSRVQNVAKFDFEALEASEGRYCCAASSVSTIQAGAECSKQTRSTCNLMRSILGTKLTEVALIEVIPAASFPIMLTL